MENNIYPLMKRKKLTLDDIAAKTKLAPSAISMIANEHREPKYKSAVLIARALGVKPEKLFKF